MTRVLTVGYDGSAPSHRALAWAAQVAERDGAQLRAVSCFTAPAVVDPWFVAIPIDIDQVRREVEDDLSRAVSEVRAAHPDLDIRSQVVWGKPRAELPKAAEGSDLLVVGTTGAGAAESWLLGSVAQAVVRSSPCPVALVPDLGETADAPAARRVIVAVDGSQASDHALDWAVDEADARDAELVVVHAWEYEYGEFGTAQAGHDLVQVDAARVLDRSVERARERARGPVRGELFEAVPAEAVGKLAVDADLVVVGSRGRGGLRSTLFGSVAQSITAHSPRPVVVVRHHAEPHGGPVEHEGPDYVGGNEPGVPYMSPD